MAKIEGGVGVEAFNERVRECMRACSPHLVVDAVLRADKLRVVLRLQRLVRMELVRRRTAT